MPKPFKDYAGPEQEALVARLRDCTIPLIGRAATGELGVHGSGTLFTWRGSNYIVTAAHLLSPAHPEQVSIPSNPRGGPLVWLDGASVSLGGANGTFDDEDDFGVLRLEEHHASRLSGNWTFLSSEDVSLDCDQSSEFLVAGYPADMALNGIDDVGTGLFIGVCRTYQGPTDMVAKSPDPRKHVILKHGESIKLVNTGARVDTPKIEGMSGCSIWTVLDPEDAIWNARSRLKVVAVQSHYLSGRWMRGSRWNQVAQLLESMPPR